MTYDPSQADIDEALAETQLNVINAHALIAQSASTMHGDTYTLDSVREFIASLVYASDEQLDAMTCLLAVTHAVDAFTTVPRGLCVSNEPSSGKTTFGIDIPAMLAFNGWDADPTEYALKSKYIEPKRVTLLMDEISKVFGESGLGGRQNKLYKILVEGYRNTATFSISVNRVATDVSSYGVAFMTGLGTACPADLRSRSVIFTMRQCPAGIELGDSLDPSVRVEGEALNAALHSWAMLRTDAMADFALNCLRRIHPKLTGRRRQVWGPLFTIAAMAGGTWQARILAAFQSMALDASDRPSLDVRQQILMDTADVLVTRGLSQIFTADLLVTLRAMPDRDIYRKMSNDYLGKKFTDALGPSVVLRGVNMAGTPVTHKGRLAQPILEAASALQTALYPPVADEAPDELELELSWASAKIG
jgi:hypothetical protein